MLFKGIGWMNGGIKLGAIETVIGFVFNGVPIAYVRRVMRMLSRALLSIGVAKGCVSASSRPKPENLILSPIIVVLMQRKTLGQSVMSWNPTLQTVKSGTPDSATSFPILASVHSVSSRLLLPLFMRHPVQLPARPTMSQEPRLAIDLALMLSMGF